MSKAFVIDVARCNGCYNCQLACKDEHAGNDWTPYARPQPPTGHFWSRLEEHVSGKNIISALFSLALIDSPISIDELIPIAKSALEKSEMIPIFGAPLYVGMDGKSSRIPGSILDDDISPELDFFLTELIKAHLSLSVEAEILPAVQIIQKEHQIDISALEYFVHNNSFIPEDHEYYYARGLCAGFAFDFPLFCVLVIPQLENSFRHILLNNEGNPSCLDATGNQAEKNFDCVTKEQIILDKFGKPFIDLLRRLLTDPRFSKIRHSIAHGLLPYSSLNSDYAVYLWWLTLRLVLLPHLPKQ